MEPFAPLFTFTKFLGFFPSKPSKSNFYLFCYNVSLAATFLTLFILSLLHTKSDTSLGAVVSNLQWICCIALFFANVSSNWRSKQYEEMIMKLKKFDQKLKNFGVDVNYVEMKRNFFVFVSTSVGLFIYVALANLLLSDDVLSWSTVYLAISINYFNSVTLIFSVFLLRQRFYFLKVALHRIFTEDAHFKIKTFTDLYVQLVDTSKSLVSQFSLRITVLLLFFVVSLTTDVYVVLAVGFESWYNYWKVANFILIHLTEVTAIIYSCYCLKLEAREIVTLSPKLLVISVSKRPSMDVIECYFLIDSNRLGVNIFKMFCLDPSTLLSIAGSVISYLVILLQFTYADERKILDSLEN